ncbi:MAG TPA: carboxypeptidase regulatory-like domain-containing protein, partial [Anaerolineales bacterium]|nr:carboxypeptidase regulatory-like domain-containing protein [Anaerolineales bacterium]
MKSRPVFSRSFILFIMILALSSQACAISLLQWPFPSSSNTPAPGGPPPTPLPRAQVTFTVRLPEPLLPNEVLMLSIVDEVTGLALNPVDYQMNILDANTYSTVLPIPDKSVIKYRYVRNGPTKINEDTNSDSYIRYRMLLVNGPTQIVDTVSSWADKPVSTLSGNISGTVTNADTGAPIPDILVTAGGAQVLTDSAGRFQILGLRGGTHNLIAYALDGTYQTFQQGATVAENQTTPVEIRLKVAQLVNVIFTVTVPQGTQTGVPLRIAGNLLQLGNTFSDLHGGLSTVADRMPTLTPMPDGKYSVSLFLPVGADLEYKYTMGDGFWNSEFTSAGQYLTRRLLVPAQNTIIEDGVQSWQAGPNAPIVFQVTVPQNTPSGDVVYIQFNPYGWTPPIPMWNQGGNKWAYKLYGPLNIVGSFSYRYCRNAQCDSADDSQTAGPGAHGRNVSPTITPQDIVDTVNEWSWPQKAGSPTLVATNIASRGTNFMAGVELQSYYDPNTPAFILPALQNIQAVGSNWAVLTPSWSFVRSNPLVFGAQPGKDPFWVDNITAVAQARTINLNVALFPQPRFPSNANDFWSSAPRDSGWWDNWFNHYRAFAIHFADLATQSASQAVILGGDWIAPALPSGKLVDGNPSGVPADAETRWKNMIAEVRQHFHGTLIFAFPYDNSVIVLPVNVLKDVDNVYLLWSIKLSTSATPSKADMITEAGNLL